MKLQNILETIRHDLINRYGHDLAEDEINRIFDTVVAEHMHTATIEEFIPVLVERDVNARLENIFLASVLRTVEKRRNIVFVNRRNRTLAEIAAAMTRRAAGRSANVAVVEAHPENSHDPVLGQVARDRELDLTGQQPQGARVLEAADIVVYLNDTEDQDLSGRHQLVWDLPSTNGMTAPEITETVDALERQVNVLVEELGFTPASPALAS